MGGLRLFKSCSRKLFHKQPGPESGCFKQPLSYIVRCTFVHCFFKFNLNFNLNRRANVAYIMLRLLRIVDKV